MIAAVAPVIGVFLLSRGVQGIGIGLLIVSVYAAISQAYPPQLRTAVFAGFAAAWLLPSLVGPAAAGLITEAVSWHAVFLATLALVAAGGWLLVKPLRALDTVREPAPPRIRRRITAAVVVALSTAALSGAASLPVWAAIIALAVLLGVSARALRPLLPQGMRGLTNPVARLVVTRAALDSMMAAQVYLPLVLSRRDHLGPTFTGLGLTVAGITWFVASQAQARVEQKVSLPRTARIAAVLIAVGFAMIVGGLALHLHYIVLVAGWGVATAGIGFAYPRVSSAPLELCSPSDAGFTGSALQVTGTTAGASITALCAVVALSEPVIGLEPSLTAVFMLFVLIPLPLLCWLWRPAIGDPTAGRRADVAAGG